MSKYNIGVAADGYSEHENTEDGLVERWVEVFCVLATSARGEVWCLTDSHVMEEASAQAAADALYHTPDTRPDLWHACEPVYGSDAWDSESEHSLACFEADAFNEPRPHW